MPIAPNGQEDLLCVSEDMDMRRVVGLFFAVIFMLLVPTLVPAEGLLGLGMPWGSSWGQASSGCGSCGEPGAFFCAWGKCCPAVYFGYNIQQNTSRTPATFGLTNRGDFAEPLGTNQIALTPSDPSGFWLGVSQSCRVGERLGILVSGWYLFPTTSDAAEFYDPTPFPVVRQAPILVSDPRSWSSNKSEGWIDGALVLGSTCGLNLIGGFRWDSLNIQLKNPVALPGAVAVRGTPADEANLTANWYIPYFGTQACYS